MFGLSSPIPPRRFIWADTIQAGDVLVMGGDTLEEQYIEAFSETGGKFSHAAFVVNSRLMLESSDPGVWYTVLPHINATLDGESVHWIEFPHDVDDLVVLRHSTLSTWTEAQIANGLSSIVKQIYGEPYSQMHRLVNSSLVVEFLRPLARHFVWSRIPEHERHVTGVYCSELVLRLFKHINLTFLRPDAHSDHVSPNYLHDYRDTSLVTRHLDVAVPLSDSCRATIAHDDYVPPPPRPKWKLSLFKNKKPPSLQAHASSLRHVAAFAQSVNTQLRAKVAAIDLANQRAFISLAFDTVRRFMLYSHLALYRTDERQALRFIEMFGQFIDAFRTARAWIVDSAVPHGQEAFDTTRRLTDKLSRCIVLYGLTVLRETRRAKTSTAWDRCTMNRRRKRLIQQYKTLKKAQQPTGI